MSEEEELAIEYLKRYTEWETHGERSLETDILTVLNLIEKQQAVIEQLKYSITKATKIIDEYANETEKDTKKLIEYQENI